MGARFSNQIEDYSDDDFYLAEENINSCTDKSKSKGHYDICDEDICLDSTDTVDATLTVSQSAMPISLNLDQVRSIENELDDYEKVALVYLIFDDPKFALDQLTKFLYSFQDKFLFNWAVHEQSAGTNWQEKLVEALCIIQNYQIISTLGFKKDDLITRFLPHHMFTFVHVNKIRKALYFVCEALLQKHVVNLRNFTWKDLKNKGMDFKFIGTPFLEIHFLQWETLGYIKQDDLNNLCRILKQIDQLDICEKLKELIPLSQKSDNLECNMKKVNSSESNRRKSVSVFEGILDPGSSLETLVSLETSHISADNAEFITDANKYYIDPNKPGICLIINQEVFYREVDKEYQKFLPCEDKKLESRVGTEYDKERLETTFRHFGFKVQTENNLSHLEIIQKIEEVIQSVTDESSLFICIMSHGEKGVVYGVNSCRVEVKYLKRLMCIRNRRYLSGKPKILILQSCQGTKCQKIASDDDDFETDGPSSSVQEAVPPIADLFTFWATVPGYGAIRNKKKGSWFIQSLCDKMTELENKLTCENPVFFRRRWRLLDHDGVVIGLCWFLRHRGQLIRREILIKPSVATRCAKFFLVAINPSKTRNAALKENFWFRALGAITRQRLRICLGCDQPVEDKKCSTQSEFLVQSPWCDHPLKTKNLHFGHERIFQLEDSLLINDHPSEIAISKK